jgi:plasmid stabilization system protein ParE
MQTKHIARFPRAGRVVPEFGDETIREIISKPYRLVYRLGDDCGTIAIVRIWHSARGDPQFG